MSCITNIPEHIDWDTVPVDYQWSGYSSNCDEFKCANFLKVDTVKLPVYICSFENGVALGDYLSTYIFRQDYIQDMEAVFSPGCNYWFYKAWEQGAPQYEELDPWVHHIVELLMDSDLITLVQQGDASYFVFSDLATYESAALPTSLIDAAKTICEQELTAFCQQSLDDCGSTDELPLLDVSEWARSIIQHFINTHAEIEVWVDCYSEKANISISCGIYTDSINGDIKITDTDSIYEGLEESFWENYREFECNVAEAASLQENNASLTYRQALAAVFGNFVISFSVGGNAIDLDINSKADDFMYSLLENL